MAKNFINVHDNFDEAARRMKQRPKQVGFHMAIAIKKSAFLVERFAKRFTPVKTGRLRGSISADIRPTYATIQPHTNYAVFVHEGTRFISGRPFMKKGRIAAQAAITRVFAKELKQSLK